MENTVIKSESGSVEYYLNRLIQRALVEHKPIIQVYEEECLRHPGIRSTVSLKEFHVALQRHCTTIQAQANAAQQASRQEGNTQTYAKINSLSELIEQKRKQRRLEGPSQAYLPVLERVSPQGSHAQVASKISRRLPQSVHISVKAEEPPMYTPPVRVQLMPQPQPVGRPPSVSVQLPAEEEAPPEFIEISTNPPAICGSTKFNRSLYKGQSASDQAVPAVTVSGEVTSKETDESGMKSPAEGVQSSSPLNKNILTCADDISPLNVRCVKCISGRVMCAIMPCGHCCLCNICGQTVLSLKQPCPVCRKSITTVIGYSNLIYNVYR